MPEVDKPVPFARRMLAVLYDSIAVFTLIYFSAFIPIVAAGRIIEPGNPVLTVYVLIVMFGYFGLCWTHGRSLGMQAWKLRIVAGGGERYPNWREASLRFVGAGLSLGLGLAAYALLREHGGRLASLGLLLGLGGYLPALFDAEQGSFHDRLSATRLRQWVNARDDSRSAPP